MGCQWDGEAGHREPHEAGLGQGGQSGREERQSEGVVGHHAARGASPSAEHQSAGHLTGGHEGHHDPRVAGPSGACPYGRAAHQSEDEAGHPERREEGPSQVGLREREHGPQRGQEERREPHEAAPQAGAQLEQDL